MKKIIVYCTMLLILITGVHSAPVICHAEEMEETTENSGQEDSTTEIGEQNSEQKDKTDLIAGDDERTTIEEVGVDGMVPVYGTDIKDGTYSIEVESSSSMFRIVKAELTVQEGEMSAVLTLSGTGYLKLYMGTGEQAVEEDESAYAPYVEDAEGKYTYTVPVEALDKELECTAFSKRKEKWYDHQLVFQASSLPEDALLIELPDYDALEEAAKAKEEEEKEAEEESPAKTADADLKPAEISLEDGNYTMEVTLSGGTGRASVTSPAKVAVSNNTAVATIEWSSANFDYMIVNGEQYLPVNTEGNSTFEIPVFAFDAPMDVIADTTAMSAPHEIAYTLTFQTDTVQKEQDGLLPKAAVGILIVVIVAVVAAVLIKRNKNNSNVQK